MYKKIEPLIEAFQVGVDPAPKWFTDKIDNQEALLHPGDPEAVHPNEKDTFIRVEREDGYGQAAKGEYVVLITYPDSSTFLDILTEKEFHNTYQLIK